MANFDDIKKILFDKNELLNIPIDTLKYNGYKQAAVLVPIVVINQELSICLTERSDQVDHHKGQISFPGGMVEKNDCTMVDTALRETYEEIGIPGSQIEIIGKLDDVYSTTGYLIHPIVAELKTLNHLRINSREVKEIIFIPLGWFFIRDNRRLKNYLDVNGETRQVWFFSEYHGRTIWGITASILVQLIEMIKK